MISKAKKAVIHIAKAQTGMTDHEYRDLLGSVGVTSSTELTNVTFDKVMARFEALGFRTTSKPRKRARKADGLPIGKRDVMAKLEAILVDMDLPWTYVDSIAQKRFGVDAVQWLEAEDLHKVLKMMIYHQNRRRKKGCAHA
nr:regulatory protein GemA [uncultured Desulfobacter sp.]